MSFLRHAAVVVSLPILLGAGVVSCAVNPATGERQLSFIGTEREIEMGRDAHPQILQSMGSYPDSALQAYVSGLGQRMAAVSERPNLPWTFTVVDDPVVNAFALPGGFIYLTRGILAHFDSEAELAAVLGHEIGHVTARHSVNQMSQAQLAQLGLGLGSVFVPELRPFEDAAGAGLQLLFLKFGRDDERQADDLGYRYMTRLGYDPGEMVDVFRMLGRASSDGGGERVPTWLSTHPDPENREGRIRDRIAADTADYGGALVRREGYVRSLDGMVFGDDPRQGFFRGEDFYHPELAFHLAFPDGWSTLNRRASVQAVSPEEDALVALRLAEGDSPRSALRAFLGQEGIRSGSTSDQDLNGLPAARGDFAASSGEDDEVRGSVTFVLLDERLYRMLGVASSGSWSAREPSIRRALASFVPVTDSRVLSVEPARVSVVELERAIPFREFLSRYPSSVSDETAARINQSDPDDTIPAGRHLKRITGGELPDLP